MNSCPVFSLFDDAEESAKEALRVLQEGGILLFPTETVYGLGVDSARRDAVEKLFEIKGRPKEKPFQWLVSSKEIAQRNSSGWNDAAEKLASAYWPGPLTLVVETPDGTVGWRVPKQNWVLNLLNELGRPLVATSANLSGQPPAICCVEALKELSAKISLAADGGVCAQGKPSTVVSVVGEKIQILREGAISAAEIALRVKS